MIVLNLRRHKRYIAISLSIVVIILLLLTPGTVKLLLYCLNVGEPIAENYGDIIVVLGGGILKDGSLGISTQERLDLCLELYRSNRRVILISDGCIFQGEEVNQKMRDYLLLAGVDSSDILLESKSMTTTENIAYSQGIIERSGFREVIYCTSPYHQRRVNLILKSLGNRNYKIAQMKESEVLKVKDVREQIRALSLISHEYQAIIGIVIRKTLRLSIQPSSISAKVSL